MTRKTIHRENERKKNIEEIKENERSIEGERERETGNGGKIWCTGSTYIERT